MIMDYIPLVSTMAGHASCICLRCRSQQPKKPAKAPTKQRRSSHYTVD